MDCWNTPQSPDFNGLPWLSTQVLVTQALNTFDHKKLSTVWRFKNGIMDY